MQRFLELHRGENQYRVNPEAIIYVERVNPNAPKTSGCYIYTLYGTLTVDETFRQVSGRLNRLATNSNTNAEANDESNED